MDLLSTLNRGGARNAFSLLCVAVSLIRSPMPVAGRDGGTEKKQIEELTGNRAEGLLIIRQSLQQVNSPDDGSGACWASACSGRGRAIHWSRRAGPSEIHRLEQHRGHHDQEFRTAGSDCGRLGLESEPVVAVVRREVRESSAGTACPGVHRRGGTGMGGFDAGRFHERQLSARNMVHPGRRDLLHRDAGRSDSVEKTIHKFLTRRGMAASAVSGKFGNFPVGTGTRL